MELLGPARITGVRVRDSVARKTAQKEPSDEAVGVDGAMKRTAIQRFTEKYSVNEDGCWVWHGAMYPGGYGSFWNGSKPVRAHRWSYMANVGKIPSGHELDHLCRNRACVNPDHLEPVTRSENMLRSPVHRKRSRVHGKKTGRRAGLLRRVHDLPEGVTPNGRWFQSHIWDPVARKKMYIGNFGNPGDAHEAYRIARTWFVYAGVGS